MESNGLLTFHLGKMRDLVRLNPEGNYALTDEGRDSPNSRGEQEPEPAWLIPVPLDSRTPPDSRARMSGPGIGGPRLGLGDRVHPDSGARFYPSIKNECHHYHGDGYHGSTIGERSRSGSLACPEHDPTQSRPVINITASIRNTLPTANNVTVDSIGRYLPFKTGKIPACPVIRLHSDLPGLLHSVEHLLCDSASDFRLLRLVLGCTVHERLIRLRAIQ